MARQIYITTALKMLESPEHVDLVVWKKDGSILELNDCIGLKHDFDTGTRRVKLCQSGQIRCIHDYLIWKINDMEVMV